MRVVAIGGGTGLSTLLRGFRAHVRTQAITDLSAIVTVTDDGGSSGRLRKEFGVLPPGDVRRCLVALSEDEDLLSKLFEYRFSAGKGLSGHSLGNLLLIALTQITGDFGRALEAASDVLATCGHIYPATLKQVRLRAELEGGRIVSGETRISRSTRRIERLMLVPSACSPVAEALRAVERADIITLGPGSLFTSIIPNVLVKGLSKRIAASKAIKVFVGNLMTQPGETTGMSAADHVRAVIQHAGQSFFDYAVVNSAAIPAHLIRRYAKEGAAPVDNDLFDVERLGVEPVLADLVLTKRVAKVEVLRHNHEVLAQTILNLGKAKNG